MNINPFEILKNAEKLQEQMGDIEQKMGEVVVTGSAGGGMAEIDVNGRMEVLAVRLAPEIVNPDDIELLQDVTMCAFNEALAKAKNAALPAMAHLAGFLGGDKSKNGLKPR